MKGLQANLNTFQKIKFIQSMLHARNQEEKDNMFEY